MMQVMGRAIKLSFWLLGYMTCLSLVTFFVLNAYPNYLDGEVLAGQVSKTVGQIFVHNSLLALICLVPKLNQLYLWFSFGINAVVVGIAMHLSSIQAVLGRLWHVPIEVLAFCLMTRVSRTDLKGVTIVSSLVCMLLASCLEVILG